VKRGRKALEGGGKKLLPPQEEGPLLRVMGGRACWGRRLRCTNGVGKIVRVDLLKGGKGGSESQGVSGKPNWAGKFNAKGAGSKILPTCHREEGGEEASVSAGRRLGGGGGGLP